MTIQMHSSDVTTRDSPEPFNELLSRFREIRRARPNNFPGLPSIGLQSSQNISSQILPFQMQIQPERPYIQVLSLTT